MKTLGNLSKIKTCIEQRFTAELKRIDSETAAEVEKIRAAEKNETDALEHDMKSRQEAETEKAYQAVYNEEKLKLQGEFDQRRQDIIDQVFDDAMKKAAKFAESKEYEKFVKAHLKSLPSGAHLTGHSESFKKHFKGLKIDKSIIGIRAEADNVVYDLTIPALVDANRESLRTELNSVLFPE